MSRLSDAAILDRLTRLEIETPSWGFSDSGTRFGVFPQADAPRDVFERVDAAAEVQRLTGTAPVVALHFPWDAVDDLASLRSYMGARGMRAGAVNPNLFQDPDYRLGSITNPDPAVRAKALQHLLDCVRIASELGSTGQSLWLADGTNYAGQDDLRERRRRMLAALEVVYAALPPEQGLLIEYKPFEPAFYATDLADWGSALLLCRSLGERAQVLVDLGHHLPGANIEQIVGLLAMEQRLGGVHLNARRYADDDLIVGSADPFGLFMIFVELTAEDAPLPRLTIDQSFNIEPKLEAMVLSVINIQEAYAKALMVDREALRAAQEQGDILGAHCLLRDAYAADVRELCAHARVDLGAEADPVAAARASTQRARQARRGG